MTFKSPVQPLCRCCGKPIRKRTDTVYVNLESERSVYKEHSSGGIRHVFLPAHIKTKADCERLTNLKVIAVEYTSELKDGDPVPGTRRVYKFSEWDGERYEHQFFCSGTCAQDFGRMAAASGKVQSVAYVDAIKRRATG